ncbi:MAG: hypothetical protein ACTHK7_08015 [Aureliella sp.]
MLRKEFTTLVAALLVAFAAGSYSQTASAVQAPATSQTQQQDDKAAQAEKKIATALARLAPADRKLAESQRFCAVLERNRLGTMGPPVKVLIGGKPVFLCCKGCFSHVQQHAQQTLQKAEKLSKATAGLAKLSPEDRALVESQKYCAIAEGSFLGSMGAPIKLVLDGKPVFLCCQGCVGKAEADPAATLAKVAELRKAGAAH